MYSSTDPTILTEKLSEQYKKLAVYMGDNKLVINDDKTHLLVMGTPKFLSKRDQVSIDTGTVVVNHIKTEKLLGINIHESLKWKEHILSSDKSMIKLLTTRLSALKKVSKNAAFKTRLVVVNACFISVLPPSIRSMGKLETFKKNLKQ